ncbi:hypothetical protein KP509_17G006700 [Ceratopteris richardii]|nr:hypothetical protein KP509_17G006700 [Ceratopteris richardii]
MPGLLDEDNHVDGNVLLENYTHAQGEGLQSPASPSVSHSNPDRGDVSRSDEVSVSLPSMENVDQGRCQNDSDLAASNVDGVGHGPWSMTSQGSHLVSDHSTPAQSPALHNQSEAESPGQSAAVTNGHTEGNDASPSPSQSKDARHSKEVGVVTASSFVSRSSPKRKQLPSPKIQAKPKEADKEKSSSPRPTGSKLKEPAKDRSSSPKVSPAAALASKAKDVEKEKIDAIDLPSPAMIEDAEKERTLSTHKSKTQDLPTIKNKVKLSSFTVPGKRSSSISARHLEIQSPTENSKNIATVKEKEKVFPNTPVSPSKTSSKAASASHIKPIQITPTTSEKAPSSTNKTSPGKAAERAAPQEKTILEQERAPSESDKLNQKVRNLFQRRKSGVGSRKYGDTESVVSTEQGSVLTRDNPNMGPFLLKLARQAIMSGDNPQKALDYASRATKSYEVAADGKPSLDLVMSLHILAATHCTMGRFEDAVPVLQHSIAATDIEGGDQDHALAAFSGNMQLGDTYSLLGRGDDALAAYHVGLEVQKKALGEMHPHVGETCRYVAEAHTQAMQFDKAKELCQHALDIHKEHSAPASVEEATDRRLMGLICNGKGEHEAALEHLVLASMALIANGKDVDVAAVDTSIGDTYASLGRFEEAVFSYQKALTVFKASKGENSVAVASVYVSLAELYMKTGKFRECKTYCDSALRIYNKVGIGPLDEVASGLTELAVVFEALNEQAKALSLLKKALTILDTAPGQQSSIAGVEAQIGVLSYMCGDYVDARSSLSNAVSKLRGSAERTSALFGIVLNQMGLCCLHLSEIKMAVQLFEESRSVLESACGPHHPDTLTVYSNLAGAYDALGR